jgi:hypothetical protein
LLSFPLRLNARDEGRDFVVNRRADAVPVIETGVGEQREWFAPEDISKNEQLMKRDALPPLFDVHDRGAVET